MQIQPQFHTLGQLLNGRLFKIPEYQRAYSWVSKQREDLFEDIRKVREAPDRGHFMATMVGLRRGRVSIGADEFTELDIVDGQQRLTTITILLRALCEALGQGNAKENKLAADVASLLVKGDALKLLLLQTNHDSSHIFIDYLRDGKKPKRSTAETVADQNLVDAIHECEESVTRWVTDGGTATELLALIRNRLSVIFHEIEDESLVYTVFEVLNSRGLDVTWFDKLKAMLMAVVFEHGDAGGKKATIDELHNLWRDIYRIIGMRQNLNRETVRFAGTLRASEQPNRPLGEEDAVLDLMSQCGQTSKGAVDCSKWILRVTKAEDELLKNHRLRAVSQIMQARLVAIAILMRGFPAQKEADLLRRWENVTFRIYGLAANDARTAVGDYVRLAWRILNEKLDVDTIAEELTEIGQHSPVAQAVEGLWRRQMYPGRAEVLRYLLYRYEEHLSEEAGQDLNESQWNKIWADEPARSVEHIKPQSSGTAYMHRLGNLILLPPGQNSKLQDKDPKEKAKAYETSGLLGAIEVARSIKRGGWTLAGVEKREKALMKWALREWGD